MDLGLDISMSDQSEMDVIEEQNEMATPLFNIREEIPKMLNINSVTKIESEHLRSNDMLTNPTENQT